MTLSTSSTSISSQRLLTIRLLCWLAVPVMTLLSLWGISRALSWASPWSTTSINYTLAFCLMPILILISPGLIQALILRRLLPETRLSITLWLLISILAAIAAWLGLWICGPLFWTINEPQEPEVSLLRQMVGAAILGGGMGTIMSWPQGLFLNDRAPDIAPGWLPLNLSSWVATAIFYLVLLPALLRPEPYPVLNETPISTACRLSSSVETIQVSDPSFSLYRPAWGSGAEAGLNFLAATPPEPRLGHVSAVAFSPDGQTVAAGGEGQVILLEVETGVLRATLPAHGSYVTGLAFSPDGQLIASRYGWDGSIILYKVGSELTPVTTLMGKPGDKSSFAFSPDGKLLATGEADTIKLWDLQTKLVDMTLVGHAGPVTAVTFSPDGRFLASGSADTTIRIWEVKTGHLFMTLRGHGSEITSLVFNSSGRLLASGNGGPREHGVRLWAIPSGKQIRKLQGYTAHSLAFSPEGQTVIIGGDDELILWNITRGLPLRNGEDQLGGRYTVAASPEGRLVATGGSFGLLLWEAATGKILAGYGFYGTATSLAFSPDGTKIATGSRNRAWSISTRVWALVGDNLSPGLQCNTGSIEVLAFSPEGQSLVQVDSEGSLQLWRVDEGSLQATYRVGQNKAPSTSGGETIWSSVGVVELAGPSAIAEEGIMIQAFSADGRWLAGSSLDGKPKLWAVQGSLVAELEGGMGPFNSFVFSPDGARLAGLDSAYQLSLWTIPQGRLLAHLSPTLEDPYLLAFSPNSQYLALAGIDKRIQVWTTAGPELLVTFTGHADSLNALAFSPDSQILASAGGDNTLRLWSLKSQIELLRLTDEDGRYNALAFAPDGSKLAGLREDGRLVIWQVIDF